MNKSILLVIASVILAVTGQTILKIGMDDVGRIGSAELARVGDTILRVATTPKVVIGLSFYVLSAALYMVALSRVDLSVAYPFAGLSYLVITLIAWLFLKEDIPSMRWLGVAVITTGVFIVSRTV